MKSKLLKLVGAGVLAIGISVASTTLPASAQVAEPEVEAYEDDDGFDWGLLGLLGLIGLAGLSKGDKHSDATAYRDPNR